MSFKLTKNAASTVASPSIVHVRSALQFERNIGIKAAIHTVKSVTVSGRQVIVDVHRQSSISGSALDDSLESGTAVWGQLGTPGAGEARIVAVDANVARLAIELIAGTAPVVGSSIKLFPVDFLKSLTELWGEDHIAKRALENTAMLSAERSIQLSDELPPELHQRLRERQREAFKLVQAPRGLLFGPPGTGKTTTIGALIGGILHQRPNARILLVGPTHVSVDMALLAADDALRRANNASVAMRRIGVKFDPLKYEMRLHLLPRDVADNVPALLRLIKQQPPKSRFAEYADWKRAIVALQATFSVDVDAEVANANVVAMTTTMAFNLYNKLTQDEGFDFVICDEASQVTQPAARLLTTMARRQIFAGDPRQLGPVIQTKDVAAATLLKRTAFEIYANASVVQLNQQSRMVCEISKLVSDVFYNGDLGLCPVAASDAEWQSARSPWFAKQQRLAPIHYEEVEDAGAYSREQGGLVRFSSQKRTEAIVAHLNYVDPSNILVLTPFRAQASLLRRSSKIPFAVDVSTIHKAQGAERNFVIIDLVNACSKFLNSEDGRRLINVAISRAQAHVVLLYHRSELANPIVKRIIEIARAQRAATGPYLPQFEALAEASAAAQLNDKQIKMQAAKFLAYRTRTANLNPFSATGNR